MQPCTPKQTTISRVTNTCIAKDGCNGRYNQLHDRVDTRVVAWIVVPPHVPDDVRLLIQEFVWGDHTQPMQAEWDNAWRIHGRRPIPTTYTLLLGIGYTRRSRETMYASGYASCCL